MGKETGSPQTADSSSRNDRSSVQVRKQELQEKEASKVLEKANQRLPKCIPFQGMPLRKPQTA